MAELSARQGERLHAAADADLRAECVLHAQARCGRLRVDALQFPADLSKLPLTTKAELIADQAANPPWGTVLTEPIEHYTRYCQTSSTTGRPLCWIDTNESWQWMLECWKTVYRAAGVKQGDRVFFPFSFGPFLGFWTGFEAGCQTGAALRAWRRHVQPAAVGDHRHGWRDRRLLHADLRAAARRGGRRASTRSPAVREQRASADRRGRAWRQHSGDARADRAAMGGARDRSSWGHRSRTAQFRVPRGARISSPERGRVHLRGAGTRIGRAPCADGESGELVVTNLGRTASPVVRYRTGDIVVRRSTPCACGRTWARLEGGVLARVDDMINIRGVNVYPAAIESVVRAFFRSGGISIHSVVGRIAAIAPGRGRGGSRVGRWIRSRCDEWRTNFVWRLD